MTLDEKNRISNEDLKSDLKVNDVTVLIKPFAMSSDFSIILVVLLR